MKAIYETRYAKVGEADAHYTVEITSAAQACSWVRTFLSTYFADKLDQEEMLVALLDTKHKVKRVIRATRGTLDASLAHPREIFRAAVAEAAASILLIHNHPSGDPAPSGADYAVTARMREAGKILGIEVIDHIVVGDDVISLRETGNW